MAIYYATYTANVLIADDNISAVEISSQIMPYNEFLQGALLNANEIFGVNVKCQNPIQLSQPMIQMKGDNHGEVEVDGLIISPNAHIIQYVGSVDYNHYVVAPLNEIKYKILAGNTVQKDVYFNVGTDDVFSRNTHHVNNDAPPTELNASENAQHENSVSAETKYIQDAVEHEIQKEIAIALRGIADLETGEEYKEPYEDYEDESKPKKRVLKKRIEYKPMSANMAFLSVYLGIKKGSDNYKSK